MDALDAAAGGAPGAAPEAPWARAKLEGVANSRASSSTRAGVEVIQSTPRNGTVVASLSPPGNVAGLQSCHDHHWRGFGPQKDGALASAALLKVSLKPEGLRRSTPNHVHDQGNHEQNQEDEEQDLGDIDGRAGESAKSENTRDQGHDEENNSPPEHR
jgi:hypothetical protein